jgi:hypothetical protein
VLSVHIYRRSNFPPKTSTSLARRLATNLSSRHWEILENLTKKYLTQRKALEHLLDNAEKGGTQLSAEDEIKLHWSRNRTMVIVPKVCWRLLIEGKLLEAMQAAVDGTEISVEEQLRKPFKDCTLAEVIQALMEMSMAYNLITSWKLTRYSPDGKRGGEKQREGQQPERPFVEGDSSSNDSKSGEEDYDWALTFYHNEGELYGSAMATVIERCIQKKGAITHVSPNTQFGVFILIKEKWPEMYTRAASPGVLRSGVGKESSGSEGRQQEREPLIQKQR